MDARYQVLDPTPIKVGNVLALLRYHAEARFNDVHLAQSCVPVVLSNAQAPNLRCRGLQEY